MKENWIKFFVNSAGALLLVAAVGRFLIGLGQAQVLSLPDPAIGIPLRYGVLIVGGLELVVALICFFGKSSWRQSGWIAWLATDFIVFQAGLLWMRVDSNGTCIGVLTDPLHLSRGVIGTAVSLCPFFLLLGSYGTLAWLWIGKSKNPAKSFSKMSCPACGTHIKFSLQNLGQAIACPYCHATVKLRKPEENLKMPCYFCKGHIEFPPYAIGTKMACPHCKLDITLKEPATA